MPCSHLTNEALESYLFSINTITLDYRLIFSPVFYKMEEDEFVKRYNLDASVLGDLVQRYKLNVSVLGDRNREILHVPSNDQSQEQKTITKIWQQKRALAHHVYLEESQFGELRAIKQVHWRDVKRDLRELQVMGRVTEV